VTGISPRRRITIRELAAPEYIMRNRFACPFGASLLAALCFAASPANGQSGDGYLFRSPALTLFVNGGFARPSASSDLFADASERLTLKPGDFLGGAVNAGLSINIGSRVAVGATVGYAGRTVRSEYIDWEDDNGLPIEQNTLFSRVPVMAQVKLHLVPRGREIGNFAWVPATISPYVGVGAGWIRYEYEQAGDFIDFDAGEPPPVFTSSIDAEGWSSATQVFAGLDYNLNTRLMLTGEAGYTRASADLPVWFEDFEPIDLSGFAATVGLSLRI
jgi:hypothetical protein